MNLEDVEVGMKVKVVGLKNTVVGGLPVKVGDIVEVYGIKTKCCGNNNTLELFDEWSISHLDVENVKDTNNKASDEFLDDLTEDDVGKTEKTPIKSDGGSSSYYFTKLPQHMIDKIVETGGIEIKDITRYVYDNDSDCKDITKALKRIQEWKKGGGKQGIDALYDANKIIFFAEELRESIKNDFGDQLN